VSSRSGEASANCYTPLYFTLLYTTLWHLKIVSKWNFTQSRLNCFTQPKKFVKAWHNLADTFDRILTFVQVQNAESATAFSGVNVVAISCETTHSATFMRQNDFTIVRRWNNVCSWCLLLCCSPSTGCIGRTLNEVIKLKRSISSTKANSQTCSICTDSFINGTLMQTMQHSDHSLSVYFGSLTSRILFWSVVIKILVLWDVSAKLAR